MNHFNICPSCIHQNTCVLTTQKDKVWSCSEFDEIKPKSTPINTVKQPKQELSLV